MNITDAIWRNCHAFPAREALVFEGRPITYRAFCNTVELVSARLTLAGVRRGDCVAISLHNPSGFLAVLLALARIGAAGTALRRNAPDALKQALLERHAARALVQDADDHWRCQVLPDLDYLTSLALFQPAPAGGLPSAPVDNQADDATWFLALSSGTTGVPKSIPQTHARANLTYTLAQRSAMVAQQRVLVFADIAISLGLGNVMRTLIAGGTVVLTGNSQPQNFFKVVERDRPVRVVTSTGLAGKLVTHAANALPLSRELCASVQTLQVAGSAVPPAMLAGIGQYICPQLEINYGSTEAGGLALSDNDTRTQRPESAGRIYPWVQAQAVDTNDQPLPIGQAGLLRFKTPSLVSGYWQDAQATARMFRDGWYYPGDMGGVDEAGYITLSGRVDQVLNLGGNKLDPVVIEQVLNTHPGVMESAVVAVPKGETGALALVAVVVAQAEVNGQALQQLCLERLGSKYVPTFVVQASSLPKNEGGKIMRGELTSRYQLTLASAAKV